MILGQGLRLIIQALYFVEIARSLGVRNYGAFVSVVALVGIVYPFGSLGSGNLLVKNVSRNPSLFPPYWGRALLITFGFGVFLFAFVLALSRFALPREIPLALVAMVAISDIVGLNLITQAGQAFQAFEKLQWTAALNVLMSAGRLLGALMLIALHPRPSALQWGYIYLGCTAAVAVIALALVRWRLGPARIDRVALFSESREGFYFSASQTSQTIYNDIDKTMLARLSTLDAAGIYGAAYRLIDVSFVPVSAALWSAYPNFFRAGARGIAESLRFAKPLMRKAILYAGAVCLLLLIASGIVPLVLGKDYAATASALRWLAILPVLKAMHYFLSDTLTSAGYQGVRTSVQAGVAVFNIAINLWLIPAYSWRGAAWSSIASDALLLAGVASSVVFLARRAALPRPAGVASSPTKFQVEPRLSEEAVALE
jgi:O-antigen/teichoic acid export membrane protein